MSSCIKSDILQIMTKANIFKHNFTKDRYFAKHHKINTRINNGYVEYVVDLGEEKGSSAVSTHSQKLEALKAALESQDRSELKYVGSNKEENSVCFAFPLKSFSQNVIQNILHSPKKALKENYLLKGLKKEKIIVEFSSPNLAKPFHMGHLKSTTLGNFVSNIHENVGNEVTRINYIGDWGTQYGFLGVGYDCFGSEDELRKNPILHLLQIYIKINSLAETDKTVLEKAKNYFARMEKGDPTLLEQWKQFRELSFADLERTYKRLGITFHSYQSESMFYEKSVNLMEKYYHEGLLSDENNAKYMEIQINGDARKVILQKADGSTIYLSRDVAAAIDRMEKYNFDQMFYVVDSSQRDHFISLKEILKSVNESWFENIHHVQFGRINKFSTRKGTAVLLDDILDEAKERMLEEMKKSENTRVIGDWEEVADILGISALLINDMQKKRQLNYEFKWENMIRIKGNLGTMLQYSHARLCSLFRKLDHLQNLTCDVSCLTEDEAVKLIHYMSKFDDAVALSYQELQPCIIVGYLAQLRNAINSAWKKLPVKDETELVAQARFTMFHCAKTILAEGLRVLGLIPLSRM